jgi:hypothetical protein
MPDISRSDPEVDGLTGLTAAFTQLTFTAGTERHTFDATSLMRPTDLRDSPMQIRPLRAGQRAGRGVVRRRRDLPLQVRGRAATTVPSNLWQPPFEYVSFSLFRGAPPDPAFSRDREARLRQSINNRGRYLPVGHFEPRRLYNGYFLPQNVEAAGIYAQSNELQERLRESSAMR